MKTPLPPVLRAALYRRAVACAWLTVCERQHRYPHLTLESLEAAIAAELEGFYLRQHGEEKGRQIACALLEDLMESGPLKAAPSLSFLGLVVMDELCARHIKRRYCTEGEQHHENERNRHRQPCARPLAAYSPGAGDSGAEEPSSALSGLWRE